MGRLQAERPLIGDARIVQIARFAQAEAEQIEDVIGIDATDAVQISAKTGLGIPEVLEAIVTRLPAPKGDRDANLKAMLVDSWYDPYLGVVVMIIVVLIDYRHFDRFAYFLYAGCMMLLVLTLLIAVVCVLGVELAGLED